MLWLTCQLYFVIAGYEARHMAIVACTALTVLYSLCSVTAAHIVVALVLLHE